MDPLNPASEINLFYNRKLLGEVEGDVELSNSLKKKMERYRDPNEMLRLTGPIDEPDFVHQFGEIMSQGGNPRQAVLMFTRALELILKMRMLRFG